MATRQYVGARYVPKFADPVAWESGKSYEALTIVNYLNNSYTSKKSVPTTIGNPADNSEYWVVTGNYNAQVEEYRLETEKVQNDVNKIKKEFINPIFYGAYFDGINDDTEAINNALKDGNVIIPNDVTVILSEISIPAYRIIDFNNATVKLKGSIKVGNYTSTSLNRGVTIKNAYFQQVNNVNCIELSQAIFCNLENLYCSNIVANTDFINVNNSYNVFINNCNAGNNNSARISGARGIVFESKADGGVATANNITNCKISNCLIQRVEKGIYLTSNYKIDSFEIDNCGFSDCNIAIETNGGYNHIRSILINSNRCEFCNTGIKNYSNMSINHFNFIGTSDYICTMIDNHDFLCIHGGISQTGGTSILLNNASVIFSDAFYDIAYLDNNTVGEFVGSFYPSNKRTLASCNIPFYNYFVTLNTSESLQNITNPREGEILKIYANGSGISVTDDSLTYNIPDYKYIEMIYKNGQFRLLSNN